MRKLDTLHISYTEHQYDASDGHIDGVAVAMKCGLDPDQVFKTLVTQGNDRNFYVFVIPVREELDLKKCAMCTLPEFFKQGSHSQSLFFLT